ncbi:MAG TPA: endonuclease/exonuclease/phosphatase family protein [Acidothermaceae bacterium]|nr:endonuclease/exonuclease/phosphatase family protein [Acidothermaceae bacterium]
MPTELRVLSYNVRSLRDDSQAVSTVIRACEPDVVCVQEAPRFLRWRSKCAALARESGLVVVTGGRPAGAMLLLASLRVRVVRAQDVLLSRKRGLHQRGIALATLELGGSQFCVGSIHLDLDAGERRRHVDEIVERTSSCSAPVIVAGDINEEPDGPAWRALAQTYPDAFEVAPVGGAYTYSATHPVRRIDGIFVDSVITVDECGVPDVPGIERASDHRPVLAVLHLP